MYEQISMFDILTENEPEPPILLEVGQMVYKTVKGDVKELYVYDEKSWLCGENKETRGYRLKYKDGCYDCAWNNEIGICIFTEYEKAKEVAEEFLNTHDVILAEDIHPIKTVAHQYTRDIDGRKMTAFYCELDNGMLYINEFMTFHYMIKNSKKVVEKFMKQQEFRYEKPIEVNYAPAFKNMYKCKGTTDWEYAEAGFSYAVG